MLVAGLLLHKRYVPAYTYSYFGDIAKREFVGKEHEQRRKDYKLRDIFSIFSFTLNLFISTSSKGYGEFLSAIQV